MGQIVLGQNAKNDIAIYDYDVLFLGGLFPNGYENELLKNSKRNVQNAANNLQWSLVRGLDMNLKNPVKILNSVYVGSFPFLYRKPFIDSYGFSHINGAEDKNVGFLNIPLLKHWSRQRKLKKYIRNWTENSSNKKRLAVAYAATPVMVKSLSYIKSLDSSIATCLVVPDLPEHMNVGSKNEIYKKVKDIATPMLYDEMSKCDSFVYLTEAMAEKAAPGKPYVVVEGIATTKHPKKKYGKVSDKTTFLYTGGINSDYGVIELVEAFTRIDDPNIRLQLCGGGADVDNVKDYCKQDNRIEYLGLLPYEQILDLQVKADFLINPRRDSGEFTKYSFPSKIIEYLASGTPTISYILSGFPKEYKKYLLVIDIQKGIGEAIIDASQLSRNEIELIGHGGASFVRDEKSEERQVAKILKMIDHR